MPDSINMPDAQNNGEATLWPLPRCSVPAIDLVVRISAAGPGPDQPLRAELAHVVAAGKPGVAAAANLGGTRIRLDRGAHLVQFMDKDVREQSVPHVVTGPGEFGSGLCCFHDGASLSAGSYSIAMEWGGSGGQGGIRTHGAQAHYGFQDRCHKPLGHLSDMGRAFISALSPELPIAGGGFEPPTSSYSPVSSPRSAPRIYVPASLSDAPVPEDRSGHS